LLFKVAGTNGEMDWTFRIGMTKSNMPRINGTCLHGYSGAKNGGQLISINNPAKIIHPSRTKLGVCERTGSNVNRNRLLIGSVVVITTVMLFYIVNNILIHRPVVVAGFDKFGIKEIYPTKIGGEEWFMTLRNRL